MSSNAVYNASSGTTTRKSMDRAGSVTSERRTLATDPKVRSYQVTYSGGQFELSRKPTPKGNTKRAK